MEKFCAALRLIRNSTDIGAVLARGSANFAVIQVLGAALAYLLQVLLARWMGADEFGLYIYAFSWVAFLALPAQLGFNTALLRLVAQYNVMGEYSRLKGLLQRSHQLTLLSSFIVAGVGIGVVLLLRDSLTAGLLPVMIVAFGLIPILVTAQLSQATSRALRYVKEAYLPEYVMQPFIVICIAFLVQITRGSVSALAAMNIKLLAVGLSLVVRWFWLWRMSLHTLRQHKPIIETKFWLSVSIPLVLFSASSLILNQTDILMIGTLLNPAESGIYSVAVKTANLTAFALAAVNAIAAPMIASLYQEGRIQDLQNMVKIATIWIFWISLPICLMLILGGHLFLRLFGEEFMAARLSLAILAVGQLFNAMCGSVGNLMIMTGYQNESAKVIAYAAILNLVLNGSLIPLFGIYGAAISTAVSTILWNIWLMILVYKRLGIKSSVIMFMLPG